jgi:hypothetical protein
MAAEARRAIVATRIGPIDLANGAPSPESAARLRDELDFQRATQAYLWAMPTVTLEAVRIANARTSGVDINEVGLIDDYAAAFIDLARDGPVVIDSPRGAHGVIDDYWQRPIVDVGPQGGTFLVVPPGDRRDLQDALRSATNRAIYLVRGPAETLARIRIFPLARADDPPQTPIRHAATSAETTLPRGFAYWERLAAIIEHEPIDERDGAFHAMLKPLGLEKGTPFTPAARQRAILTEAAEIGFLMAQALPWDQGPVSPSLS